MNPPTPTTAEAQAAPATRTPLADPRIVIDATRSTYPMLILGPLEHQPSLTFGTRGLTTDVAARIVAPTAAAVCHLTVLATVVYPPPVARGVRVVVVEIVPVPAGPATLVAVSSCDQRRFFGKKRAPVASYGTWSPSPTTPAAIAAS